MRVVVLFNPRSGRGKAAALGHAIDAALRDQNATSHVLEASSTASLELIAAPPDALIVCGGDGTVHHLLQRSRSVNPLPPLYHAPTGTENLFAREFGSWPRASAPEIARRVLLARSRPIDLAIAADRVFALMLSVGFDASVVERVSAARTGRISRWTYARPILQEATRPTLARLRVRADGRTLIDGEQGLLIIANARQYAARLNPARHADPSDGRLDVVFMPARGSLNVARWALLCLARKQTGARGFRAAQAGEIEIESLDAPAPLQMDGEHAGALTPGSPLKIRVAPGAMRVTQFD